MRKPFDVAFISLTCGLALACDSGNGGSKDTDVELPDDTNTHETPEQKKWKVSVVESDVGIGATLDVNADGTVGIAYFGNHSTIDGECTEIVFNESSTKNRERYELKFATKSLDDSEWQIETVDNPIYVAVPEAPSFKYTLDGHPAIAYRGGDPEIAYCGANDAFYTVKQGDTWNSETAAANSNDALANDEASDAGFGVGFFPALTLDPDGEPAIVYQDQHFVYLQRDDDSRADAELAWRRGGGWMNEPVDFGAGAGTANAIIFDSENRPIVFSAIPIESHGVSRHGVWAYRRNDDGTWDRIQIVSAGSTPGNSF